MLTEVFFLIVDKNGLYRGVDPDFERGKIFPNDLLYTAHELVPFGFKQSFKANGFGYSHALNSGKTKQDVRLSTFKDLIDHLHDEAKNLGLEVAFILINIKVDQDYGTYWHLEADYQFLL